jgi:hypothetical protein
MSQLLGASRHLTSFGTADDADERLTNMLTLYKAPASIRDMKQVYFYVQAQSTTTNLPPLEVMYNVIDPLQPRNFYYAPIGTTRQFDICSKVNDLLDIRVPKDKYVIEINLVECGLECDTTGWITTADRVVAFKDDLAKIESTFKWVTSQSPFGGGVEPARTTLDTTLQEATKQTQPQTLYCRIRELNNGEPYNWAITNSGNYSVDKSHQLLVRHGDINYSKLTLEFGHLAFTGLDLDYERFIRDPSQTTQKLNTRTKRGIPRETDLIERYDKPVYVDYNREAYNVLTDEGDSPYLNADYPEFYKGIGGVDFTPGLTLDQATIVKGARNFVQPVNRPPFLPASGNPPGPPNDYFLQGRPYFYNQQAAKINFRFMIRIIHMF